MLSNIITAKWYKFSSHVGWYGQDFKEGTKNISPPIRPLYDKNKEAANIEGGGRIFFPAFEKLFVQEKRGLKGWNNFYD